MRLLKNKNSNVRALQALGKRLLRAFGSGSNAVSEPSDRSLEANQFISSMPTTKKSTKTSVTKTVKKSTKKTSKKTAKKAVKKSTKKTTKKATKKATGKSTTKKVSKAKVRALVCAAGEECFWTSDGQVLENLEELALAFGSMDEEVFLHHVTKEKNDFADWVEAVLADAECAAALRRSRKPRSARTVVVRYLKQYA